MCYEGWSYRFCVKRPGSAQFLTCLWGGGARGGVPYFPLVPRPPAEVTVPAHPWQKARVPYSLRGISILFFADFVTVAACNGLKG